MKCQDVCNKYGPHGGPQITLGDYAGGSSLTWSNIVPVGVKKTLLSTLNTSFSSAFFPLKEETLWSVSMMMPRPDPCR